LQLIEFYQQEHRFPILPDDLEAASEQGHQPPLYYLLMAGLIEAGLPELDMSLFEFNPFHLRDNYNPDLPPYNRTLYLQTWADDPLGTPPIRTAMIFRLVDVVINLIGIGFIWRAGVVLVSPPTPLGGRGANLVTSQFTYLEGEGINPTDSPSFLERGLGGEVKPKWLPLVAISFLMLTPTFWRTAIPVNNNHLLFLFAATLTYLMARILRDGLHWRLTIALGICLGLGLLSKIYIAPLVIPIGLTYRMQGRRAIKHLVIVGILAGVIAGWWYIRNMHLYNDFTAISVTEDVLDSRRAEPMTLPEALEESITWTGELWIEAWTILNTRASLWIASGIGIALLLSSILAWLRGRFKKMLIPASDHLLFGIAVLGVASAVSAAARNLHGAYSPPVVLFALPSLSLLMAMGILGWSAPYLENRVAISAVSLILLSTVIFHAVFFEPLFPPLHRADTDDLAILNRLSIDFENGARLVGYELKDRTLRPGDHTAVKLCWEATRHIEKNYAFTVKLLLPDLPNAAIQDGYPLSGRYPTVAWEPGTSYCEWVPLQIAKDAVTPRAYFLFVGMYELAEKPVSRILLDGRRTTNLTLDRVSVTEPVDVAGIPPNLGARIGDWGRLLSFDYTIEDGVFHLTLDWLTIKSSPVSYQYYIHALDENGEIVAQTDPLPLNNGYPTDFWQPNTRFTDTLSLPLPSEAVVVKFGMYDPVTFQRGLWRINGEILDGISIPLE
jgi:hypothetical protein